MALGLTAQQAGMQTLLRGLEGAPEPGTECRSRRR